MHRTPLPSLRISRARPSIPEAGAFLGGLCAAAGLCLERAEPTVCGAIGTLRARAAAVQSAMLRSRIFFFGVRCLMACRRDVACRSLRRAAACTKDGGCAWASRLGSQRRLMRRRRRRVPLPPLRTKRARSPPGRARSASGERIRFDYTSLAGLHPALHEGRLPGGERGPPARGRRRLKIFFRCSGTFSGSLRRAPAGARALLFHLWTES